MMNTGIVLKNYLPHKYKLSVLDCNLGRIEALVRNKKIIESLAHGAHIEYMPIVQQPFYCLEGLELIDSPFIWAVQDLAFFHHMLEIAYFFLPLHAPMPTIFELFVTIYNLKALSEYEKKLIICKFFAVIGIYPDNAHTYFPALFSLISSSRDIILNEVEMIHTHELTAWIKACIAVHPYAHRFKTTAFLT